jgi:hypothetical protein
MAGRADRLLETMAQVRMESSDKSRRVFDGRFWAGALEGIILTSVSRSNAGKKTLTVRLGAASF